MAIEFKKKCPRCKKNFVKVTRRQETGVLCYECDKKQMQGEITDPEMKKLFDIPEEYYQQNAFLRDIKINYMRFGKLTDKQIDAFKRTVEKLKNGS